MIITVTLRQFLVAVSQEKDYRLLMEDDTSFILMEDDASFILKEFFPWFQNMPADSNNPSWIELYSAKLVRMGDPLYTEIQMLFNYTSPEMRALFAAAVKVPR